MNQTVDSRALLQHIWDELMRLIGEKLQIFATALENWINTLLQRPLPPDWRKQLAQFLAVWDAEGYEVLPEDVRGLENWIEAWARLRGVLPAAVATNRASSNKGEPTATQHDKPLIDGRHEPPAIMLELAYAWYCAKIMILRYRDDVERLPRLIAREEELLAAGGRYSHHHSNHIAGAKRDLATAKAMLPQLEQQQRELEQAYHDLGFDDLDYGAFTPGESLVGGRGIDKVGYAAYHRGTPAGLRSTGIEFDIALLGPGVLRLAKLALARLAIRGAVGTGRHAAYNELAATVQRAKKKLGAGSGPVYGTKIHSALETEIKALGNPNLTAEVSYLRGKLVRRGILGSIRVDVVEGSLDYPTAIYDLKTGVGVLTPARIAEIQRHKRSHHRNSVIA